MFQVLWVYIALQRCGDVSDWTSYKALLKDFSDRAVGSIWYSCQFNLRRSVLHWGTWRWSYGTGMVWQETSQEIGILGRHLHRQRLLPSTGDLHQELQRDNLHSLLWHPSRHCRPLHLHPTQHLPDSPNDEDERWMLIIDTGCPVHTHTGQEDGY